MTVPDHFGLPRLGVLLCVLIVAVMSLAQSASAQVSPAITGVPWTLHVSTADGGPVPEGTVACMWTEEIEQQCAVLSDITFPVAVPAGEV